MSFKLFVSIGELSLSKRLQELAEGNPWENVTFGLTSNMVPGVNSISDRNLLYPLTQVLRTGYGVNVAKAKIAAPNFRVTVEMIKSAWHGNIFVS